VFVCSCGQNLGSSGGQVEKVKAVVLTGGHGFAKEPFFAMFDSFEDIEYVEAAHEKDLTIFDDVSGWDRDVIVMYNMGQEITAEQKANFIKLLNDGVGLVAMHHNIGAFQGWPEYRKIIGGKWYSKAMEEDGVMHGKSKYKHDLDISVRVEDSSHPITAGTGDFTIFDETYGDCFFESDNHVLLSTDHPTSDGPLGWVRKYGKARVCYIQMGHGVEAYENENYRRLVNNTIKWCAN